MIHITEQRDKLVALIQVLREDTIPSFGLMTPQHMIEHVAKAVSISNGNRNVGLLADPARAEKQKRIMLYTDRPFPMGMQAPLLDGALDVLEFATLKEAKDELVRQLDEFDAWYQNHDGSTCMHPFLGALTHDEWVVFHNKHITHHFSQFGLI